MKEGKKLEKHKDLPKTPVKKDERQRIISVEKLIENWTLEERLAGHNRYKKVIQQKGDRTKETKLYSKQGNENKLFKTV